MGAESSPRADKFLWSVRIFKTRVLALEACKKGRIRVNNQSIKASKPIKEGDEIEVRKPPVTYTFRVIAVPKSRLNAKFVADHIEDKTPDEERLKLETRDSFYITRDRGTGRPTKKERRTIDNLRDT